MRFPNVLWLCSGRSDWGLDKTFSLSPTINLFPDGLPPLGKEAIRSILFETLAHKHAHILAFDTEYQGGIENPFINRVYEYSEGLPLYVIYLAGNINAGNVDPKNINARLPKNLNDAHADLLRSRSVSSHHQILTPSAIIFAIGYEPIGPNLLCDLLVRCGFLPGDKPVFNTVNKALTYIYSILSPADTPEENRFTLVHHSLRQYVDQAEDMELALSLMREKLASLALHPGEGNGRSAPYLYRAGIRHLLDVHRYNDAMELLCQFGYLVDRLHTVPNPLGTRGITEDWYRIKQRSESDVSKSAWAVFWHDHTHLFLRGIESWSASKILIQLALDYSEGGEVAKAVQDWLQDHPITTPWLHLDPRELQSTPLKKAFVFVLEGSLDYVNACAASQDGQVALCGGGSTEYRDYDLRIWDIDKQQIRRVLRGHKDKATSFL